MHGFEPGEHVAHDLHGAPRRERPAAQALAQRFAVEVCHDVIRNAVPIIHVVHGNDVLMLQLGEELRFPLEPLGRVRAGQLGTQNLDGDDTLESRVARAEYHTHPAPAELCFDLVLGGEDRADPFEDGAHDGRECNRSGVRQKERPRRRAGAGGPEGRGGRVTEL